MEGADQFSKAVMKAPTHIMELENSGEAELTSKVNKCLHSELSLDSNNASLTPKKRELTINQIEETWPKDDKSYEEWCKYLAEQLIVMNSNFSLLNENFESLVKMTELNNKQTVEMDKVITVCKKVNELTVSINRINLENSKLCKENTELKERLLLLELRQKENNVILEGIDDNPKETGFDAYNKVVSILGQLGEDRMGSIDDILIAKCKRICPYVPRRNRPLHVVFQW